MASVQVYKNGKYQYVRIVESYRDPKTKKPKIRILQNLGRLDRLEAENPNVITELKQKYETMREEASQEQVDFSLDIIQSILEDSPHSTDGLPLQNYGYIVYQYLWKQLNLDYFFKYRQKKESKITFPTQDIAALITYMRLLQPGSKKRVWENANDLYGFSNDSIDLNHLYRALHFFADQKDNLDDHLNRQLSKLMERDLSVCFYDVTTYYFESQLADDLKRFGFSKDNKVNQVQVVMGLLIDSHGIPITYELFPGNTNEFSTLEPILLRLREQYGIKKIIITADRGLNSKGNLARIRRLGFDYVMAYKIRTATRAIKSMVIDQTGYETINKHLKIKETTIEQHVKLENKHYTFKDTFILTYSAKRAAKDRKDRLRLIEKAVKLSESPSMMKSELKKGGKKYVQLSLDAFDLGVNNNKIEEDEKYDGYYGIVCSDSSLKPLEIIDTYQGLWKIEESFRVMKSNLEARPLFVWTPESIKGHFVLCYLALVIQRLLEYQLKAKGIELSSERIQIALNSAKVSIIQKDKGPNHYIKHQATEAFSQILDALELNPIPTIGRVTQIKL